MFIQIDKKGDLEKSITQFFNSVLKTDPVDFLMVPQTSEFGNLPMPTIVSADSYSQKISMMPVSPFNAANSATKILKHQAKAGIALFLRPCEIRSLVELKKLNQNQLDNTTIISLVCNGRMENRAYLDLTRKEDIKIDDTFQSTFEKEHMCKSCQSCTEIQPDHADLVLHFDNTQIELEFYIESRSDQGTRILETFDHSEAKPEKPYFEAIENKITDKKTIKDALFRTTATEISSMPMFQSIISNCLNCYNCMTACPACYCKECVFNTDVYNHDPEIYLRKAQKKGQLKIPTDTSMFHLTRLSHMSHSCVGCGQCTSACPSDIPVADFFRTVADQTQSLFDYTPGKDKQEPMPYQVFEENGCNCEGH